MKLRHSFELSDVETRGRTLDMVVVPFEEPAWVMDSESAGPYREEFVTRCAAHIDPTRVQLRWDHSDDAADYIGRFRELADDGRYLRGSVPLFNGSRADHILEIVRGGGVDGVSLAFEPDIDGERIDSDGPIVRRERIKRLPEVSLVFEPAYESAQVVAVRRAVDAERQRQRDELLAWLETQRP